MEIFNRAECLLGPETMKRLESLRVIIFGVGGVGSWCAEAMVRSGVHRLTLVDGDTVCESNINRQLMATTKTLGKPKVEVLRQRLLDINPQAEIIARYEVFTEATANSFHLADYDYIIDAIDSLRDKMLLILQACQTEARLFSSMGAAMKLDPLKIRVAEFWRVEGDPLARSLRKRFKAAGVFPARKFQCVYSEEHTDREAIKERSMPEGLSPTLPPLKGSLVHITAIFGIRAFNMLFPRSVGFPTL